VTRHARGEPTGMRVTTYLVPRRARPSVRPDGIVEISRRPIRVKERGFDYAAVSNLRRAVQVNRQPVCTGWQKRAVYSASVTPMT
jgi:hypothetical protein